MNEKSLTTLAATAAVATYFVFPEWHSLSVNATLGLVLYFSVLKHFAVAALDAAKKVLSGVEMP